MDVDRLYNRPLSVFNAYGDTLKIFFTNWKPLVTIVLLQLLTTLVTSLVTGLVFAFTFASAVKEIMENKPDNIFSRNLIDYAIGTGASRALEYYGDDNNVDDGENTNITDTVDDGGNTNIMDTMISAQAIYAIILEFSTQFIIMMIMFTLIYALVNSVFTGAMYHAAAEVYAGDNPTASKSIGYGWAKKWQVYMYSLLLWCIIFLGFGIFFYSIVTMLSHEDIRDVNIGGILLLVMVFIILLNIIGAALVAAVPSIVVESKSPIAAFKRSWNLCKGSICYIYCSIFGASISYMVLIALVNILPRFLAVPSHLCLSIAAPVLSPLLCFVLYMSIRISSENVTKDDLRSEIGNGHVELVDYAQPSKAELV